MSDSRNSTENIVEAILEGGPNSVTATALVRRDEQKLTVPRLDGYEHFERSNGTDAPAVFHWSYRTRIAE